MQQALLDGATVASPPTPGPSDYDAAYAAALRAPSDMQLMRLVMRTGPCWPALAPATAAALLAAFTRCVREGSMLHRVLPWLWRLADSEAEGGGGGGSGGVSGGGGSLLVVGAAAQRALLDALVACPAAEDMQVSRMRMRVRDRAVILALQPGLRWQLPVTPPSQSILRATARQSLMSAHASHDPRTRCSYYTRRCAACGRAAVAVLQRRARMHERQRTHAFLRQFLVSSSHADMLV